MDLSQLDWFSGLRLLVVVCHVFALIIFLGVIRLWSHGKWAQAASSLTITILVVFVPSILQVCTSWRCKDQVSIIASVCIGWPVVLALASLGLWKVGAIRAVNRARLTIISKSRLGKHVTPQTFVILVIATLFICALNCLIILQDISAQSLSLVTMVGCLIFPFTGFIQLYVSKEKLARIYENRMRTPALDDI